MASVMSNDQYPDAIWIDDAKQNRVGKSMHYAAPDLRFDDRKLPRVPGYPLHDGVDFAAEIGVQSRSGAPVV